jgi:hypothetical protein
MVRVRIRVRVRVRLRVRVRVRVRVRDLFHDTAVALQCYMSLALIVLGGIFLRLKEMK